MLMEWELLSKVQEKIDLNAFTHRGLNIWPLVRIAFHWAVYSHKVCPTQAGPTQSETGNLIYSNLGPWSSAILFLKRAAHRTLKSWERMRQLRELRSTGSCDVVFFSREQYHTELVDNAYYDRCIDPFIEMAQDHFSYEKIELNQNPERLPRKHPTRFLDATLARYRAKHRLYTPQPTAQFTQQIEIMQRFLQDEGILGQLDAVGILCLAEEVLIYRDSFLELLRAMRPKALFFTCIVDPPSMGAVAACRELGITSVEIHHGYTGNNHGLYTHHRVVPKDGFELLPDYSWMWTEEAAQAFGSWYPPGSRHRFVAGGHLWMAKCLSANPPAITPEQTRFLDSLQGGRRLVLFTGGWGEALPQTFTDALIEAMRQTQDTCTWLIRLHPNHRNTLNQVAAYLTQRGINGFEIAHSTHCPLYALLKAADHHVTLHSSTYFEAKLFGLHTTMTSKIAQKAFIDYKGDPMLHFCRDPEEIAQNVRTCPREQQAASLLVRPPSQALELFTRIVTGAPSHRHNS